MPYLYGALALVLSIFVFLLLKISLKGGSLYHNAVAAVAVAVSPFAGFYIVVFLFEMGKVFMGSSSFQ